MEAGLANEDGTPVGNITGTSDALAVDAQLQMIREILPDAKKIGIIYTTSEISEALASPRSIIAAIFPVCFPSSKYSNPIEATQPAKNVQSQLRRTHLFGS